ncbi:glyoxalase/bleomycin resistance/dioxygenase family protein [Clostridium sporogenes]|uniref:VOC family protein n=1 Tax=Clostridium TaxID=1485 RepID=UPI0006ABA675|nr:MULTISPECIES: VOC family protein [Clostridium]EJP6471223.1 VOC family protein [Clostridium botulinum]KOR24027.1 glyoxalase [Clostridium sp. L74]NFV12087.1 glyoxalase/bleomycin resistance/dioxygenase family protein [Clostridium sporogenes]
MLTNHLGIKVRDIEKVQKFYCENLEFEFEHKYEDEDKILVFLKNENSVIELIYSKNKEYNSVINGIIDHVAFTVTNIQECINKLKRKNVKFITNEVTEVDGKIIIFFEGAEGEKIELVQYK